MADKRSTESTNENELEQAADEINVKCHFVIDICIISLTQT